MVGGGGHFPLLVGVLGRSLGRRPAPLGLEWSSPRILEPAAAVFVITGIVEFIGVTSGIPFGRYTNHPRYSRNCGARAHPPGMVYDAGAGLGGLPRLSWAESKLLLKGWGTGLFAAFSRGSTAWDLYLDPQMVARELWTWVQPGRVLLFRHPLGELSRWWLTSSLITLLIRPRQLPVLPLWIVRCRDVDLPGYWVGVVLGLPGPALAVYRYGAV